MAKIKLRPEELLAQSSEMADLKAEYEDFFQGVTGVLNSINRSWSENLSNNFSGKILTAQNSFGRVTGMLQAGVSATQNAANTFGTVDSHLASYFLGNETTISGYSGNGSLQLLSSDVNTDTRKNTIKVVEDLKPDVSGAVKEYYDQCIDDSRNTTEKSYTYTSNGSTQEGTIVGDIKYVRTNDVRTYYYDQEQGKQVENVSGGGSITGQEINIYEGNGSEEGINIKLNTIDTHAVANWDPKKGNVYASAGAEYDLASIGFHIGDSKDGLGSASAHVKTGIGLSGSIGVQNGKIKISGSAAVGIGTDIDIEINYKQAWNAVIDTVKSNHGKGGGFR